MELRHIGEIIFRLMGSDYAVMLSVIVLFQAVYITWKNICSIKSYSVFWLTLICIIHVVLYQYGSFRWELFNYNSYVKIYDTNLWILIDFVGLLVSVGSLYAIDGMLNKLIVSKLTCNPHIELEHLCYGEFLNTHFFYNRRVGNDFKVTIK